MRGGPFFYVTGKPSHTLCKMALLPLCVAKLVLLQNQEMSLSAATYGSVAKNTATIDMKALILLFMLDLSFRDDYSTVEIGHALSAPEAAAAVTRRSHWPNDHIECRYNQTDSPFELGVVEAAIREAGQAWALKSGLTFEYVGTTTDLPEGVVYDCLISWDAFANVFQLGQARNYRIGNTFVGSDIRLSRWTSRDDLMLVLTHEIGHGLGLGHDAQGCIMQASPSGSQLCFADYAAITHLYPPYQLEGRPALDCTVNLLPNQQVFIPSIDGRYWARYRLDENLNMIYIEHGEVDASADGLFLCR